MEKLILKSVMYGADKIPDTWFEKVPGGFYKAKDKLKEETDQGTGSGSNGRQSNANDSQRHRSGDNSHDKRHRSDDRRRRERRCRSSYDGGGDDDDDYYHSDGDRRRPRREKSRRRRHSFDNDRYGHDDGHRRAPRDAQRDGYKEDRRSGGRPPHSQVPHYDQTRPSTGGSDRPPNPFAPGPYVDTGAAAGATRGAPPYPQSNTPQSPAFPSPRSAQAPPARNGSVNNSYVPYAHIYGQPNPTPPQQQPFSPPPRVDTSMRPNTANRVSPTVSPPPQGYQQNPLAQQAPTAADAGAGAAYTGQPGFLNQDPRSANGYDPRYSARRSTGYDENGGPSSESPDRRSSRQDYSRSNDRYNPQKDDRRARSERRNDDQPQNTARERYIDPRKPMGAQMPTQQSPPPAQNQRRQEDQANPEFQ